jgi:hypothetical protein
MSFIAIVVGGVDALSLRMLLLLPLPSFFEATSFLTLSSLFLVDDDDNDDDDDASPTALNGRFLFAALNISGLGTQTKKAGLGVGMMSLNRGRRVVKT